MLVLSRKIGESIIIDNEIKVQILEIHGGQIRLGIEAPESILVYREEIYQKILANKQASTDSANKSQNDTPQAEQTKES